MIYTTGHNERMNDHLKNVNKKCDSILAVERS